MRSLAAWHTTVRFGRAFINVSIAVALDRRVIVNAYMEVSGGRPRVSEPMIGGATSIDHRAKKWRSGTQRAQSVALYDNSFACRVTCKGVAWE